MTWVNEDYGPFLSEGFVYLNNNELKPTLIKVLRDTDASQSLILHKVVLPFSEQSSVGASVLIRGVENGVLNVPLYTNYIL